MNEKIYYDELDEMKQILEYIKALKKLKDMGYDVQSINPTTYDIDIYDYNEDTFEAFLNLIVGKKNYISYIGTQEEGEKIGYDVYCSEEENDITVIKIHNKYIEKYMQILKKHNINVYADREMNSIAEGLESLDPYNQYGTEYIFGLDYSGLYLITNYFLMDADRFAVSYRKLIKHCKKRIKQYYKNKIITFNISYREYGEYRYRKYKLSFWANRDKKSKYIHSKKIRKIKSDKHANARKKSKYRNIKS